MDSIVVWNKIQLRTSIAIVSPIFHARVVCGCHQIRGNARGPHTKDRDDNKGFSEIPLNLFLCKAWGVGGIQKFTAVFTLYRVVLNFFSAKRAFFHYHLSWVENALSVKIKGGFRRPVDHPNPNLMSQFAMSSWRTPLRCASWGLDRLKGAG